MSHSTSSLTSRDRQGRDDLQVLKDQIEILIDQERMEESRELLAGVVNIGVNASSSALQKEAEQTIFNVNERLARMRHL